MEKILNYIIFLSYLLFSVNVFGTPTEPPLKIPLNAAKVSLDPSGIQDRSSLFVSRQVNCQLVRSYGSIVKEEAAESIQFETPTKIAITIKKQAKFQDGSPVTAEDIVASLNHLRKSRLVLRNVFTWIKKTDVINSNKIIITLKEPVPQFLSVLSSPNYAIFKKLFLKRAEKNPALWKMPIGCGNYKVVFSNDHIIKLTPLREGRPIEFYLKKSNQLLANEIDQYDISDLHLLGESPKVQQFKMIEIFDPTQIFLGLNSRTKQWRNKEDRCAFISKLNPQPVISSYAKRARSADDILPEGILGHESSTQSMREIAKKYGSKQLSPMKSFCLSYLTVSIPEYFRSAYLDMVKKIYKNTRAIYITDNTHFGKKFVESDCDAIVLGLKSNTLDGYDILAIFSEIDPNFTGFFDASLTKEIEGSQNEINPQIRALHYRDIINKIENQCLVYPILTVPMRYVYLKKGLYAPNIGKSPLNEYYLGEVR